MFVRWNFTVCSVIQNSLPIARFDSPRAKALSISISRSVSPSGSSSGTRLTPSSNLSPATTLRTAPGSSWGSTLFVTYADAPRSNASSMCCRSVNAESTTNFTSVYFLRARSMHANPSSSGIRMSSSTTSGFVRARSGSTWLPIRASPTISMSSASESARRTACKISRWSSAIRILIVMPQPFVYRIRDAPQRRRRTGSWHSFRDRAIAGPPIGRADAAQVSGSGALARGYILGMAAVDIAERESAERAVVGWRFGELLRAGYDERDALELAMRADVDLHLAVRLIDLGCDRNTAVRILR